MKNKYKNIFIVILIILISVLVVICILQIKENRYLKKELANSEKYFTDIIKKNEIQKSNLIKLSAKIQAKNDSLSGKSSNDFKIIDGIKIGKTPISLEELITIANRNMSENNKLRRKKYDDSITIKNYKQILKKLEEGKLIESNMDDKMQGNLSYVNIDNYKKNNIKKDSLVNAKNAEINNYKNEIKAKNNILNLIKDNYGIDSEVEYTKDKLIIKLLNTKKIDSALWIYPYYKHKIKTNRKGETIIK